MTSIQRALKPKTLPLRSIALRPIDQLNPRHQFHCPLQCEMCQQYQHKKVTKILQNQQAQIKRKLKQRKTCDHNLIVNNFEWIIRRLMLPHNKLVTRGLNVFIPQILLFKDGQANQIFCNRQLQDATVKRINKQKISNTMIQKLFNDRRRKYRQYLKNRNGKKNKVQQKKSLVGAKKQVKKDSKDAVIIRYNDGNQSLNTQNQFVGLLLRRKQDQIWKQISYIKNMIQLTGQTTSIQTLYRKNQQNYQQLFQRSKKIIKIYGQNIILGDRDYISDQQQQKFCLQIKKSSQKIYAQYVLYKIVNFIQYFYDERINQILVKFIINEKDQIFLDTVYKLQKQQLIKFEWTNQTYIKKINQQEHRVFFAKKIQVNQQIQNKAKTIQNNMGQIYQGMKDFYGLSAQEVDNVEERANNKFFSHIYPDFKLQISQVLKDPKMTVNKFKKQYLGYKPQKKPIVKPFNSNMVNTLHRLTPKLRRAEPHNYISTPKRSISTNPGSKRQSFSVTQRSYYVNPQNTLE